MNTHVEAADIVPAMTVATTTGGLAAASLMMRHDDRAFREAMERRRADRG